MDVKKYRTSWINLFFFWIQNLPGNSYLYYFVLAVLLLGIQTLPAWIEGASVWGSFLPAHLFLSVAVPFILAVIPFFDQKAIKAFEKILLISNLDENERSDFQHKLSVLPALPAFLTSLSCLGLVILLELIGSGPYRIRALDGFPVSVFILRFVYLLCWWCYGAFIYHTARQLSIINDIYTKHTQINIFRMKPLYGFSDLTALTAGSLILLPYGFLLVNQEVTLSDPIVLGMYFTFTLVAVITFLLPQLGIHRLQQEERDRLLDEVYQRYDALRIDFHSALDQKEFEALPQLRNAIGMIEQDLATIKSISTWPWQPETFRWLFTALILPLLMWLAQYVLGKYLG